MRLLDSWKQSFGLFERKNLAVFVLVWLKTVATTYRQFIEYLIAPFFAVQLLCLCIPFNTMHVMSNITYLVFFIFLFLTVRSSVLRKTWFYYSHYFTHGLFLLPWLMLIFFVLSKIGYWWWAIVTMFIAFTAFFFLDSRPSLKNFMESHLRAAKMIMYNLPIYLIIMVVLFGVWWLYMFLVHAINIVIPVPIIMATAVLMPLETCLMANLYIKWYHEQFTIYFDQSK